MEHIASYSAFSGPRAGRDAMGAGVTDSALLARARAGDADAFSRLTEPLRGQVYSVLVGMVGQADAEDLLQEVFVRAYRGIARFRGDSALRTWITRIAINLAIRHTRRRRESRVLEDAELERLSYEPEEGATRLAVRAAVDELTPKLRAAVVLFYFEGLALNDVAEAIGINRGTVASRLHEARRILKQRLRLDLPEGGTRQWTVKKPDA